MIALELRRCSEIKGSTIAMSDLECEQMLGQLSMWKIILVNGSKSLAKRFVFVSYHQALLFTKSIAAAAILENHHPKIILEYDSVEVNWWTHSVKGLHMNDFVMAAKTDISFLSIKEKLIESSL